MEFSTKTTAPEKAKSPCVVVGVYQSGKLAPSARALDDAAKGYLGDIVKRGDLDPRPGATLRRHRGPGLAAERILLVGLGRESELRERDYRDVVRSALRALLDTSAPDALWTLIEIPVSGRDVAWKAELTVLTGSELQYRFDTFKGKTADKNKHRPNREIVFAVTDRDAGSSIERGLKTGRAIAAGVALAKDLGNTPPNVCTPTWLATQAKALAKAHDLKCQVLDQSEMEKLGMGSLLAVARGSRQPPRLIVLHYQGADKKKKPIALVGKGITFDTGGISIKPSAEMDEMKYDMSGAGSVLGTLRAVAELGLPINVVGVIPAAENMPDGAATRPGDIVKSLAGTTIEILNTDAEGRLILCDALTYTERFEPSAVVDIATLTGACVIALGHVASGLFSNQDNLADELLRAGDAIGDRAWRMPVWDEYQDQLKSNFADVANIGGRAAGSVTAACFLARFSEKFAWAHLDVAGTAWKSGKDKGSTGRPVGLLTRFLIERAGGR